MEHQKPDVYHVMLHVLPVAVIHVTVQVGVVVLVKQVAVQRLLQLHQPPVEDVIPPVAANAGVVLDALPAPEDVIPPVAANARVVLDALPAPDAPPALDALPVRVLVRVDALAASPVVDAQMHVVQDADPDAWLRQ